MEDVLHPIIMIYLAQFHWESSSHSGVEMHTACSSPLTRDRVARAGRLASQVLLPSYNISAAACTCFS